MNMICFSLVSFMIQYGMFSFARLILIEGLHKQREIYFQALMMAAGGVIYFIMMQGLAWATILFVQAFRWNIRGDSVMYLWLILYSIGLFGLLLLVRKRTDKIWKKAREKGSEWFDEA